MIFQTHEENIPQIEAAAEAYGAVFFHGDGNIYNAINKDGEWFSKESNDRLEFSNPKQEEATYRKLFVKGDTMPGSLEELNKALMDAKNQSILHQRVVKESAGVKTVSVAKEAKVLTPAGIQTPTTPGPDTNVEENGKMLDNHPDKDAYIAPLSPKPPVDPKMPDTGKKVSDESKPKNV